MSEFVQYVLPALVFAAAVGGYAYMRLPSRRKWWKFIDGRTPITDKEFIAACSEPKQMDARAVAAVRKVLGDRLEAYPEKAPLITHPDDDIWESMAAVAGSPLRNLDKAGIIREVEQEIRECGGPPIRSTSSTGGGSFRDPEELALLVSNCLREQETTPAKQD